MCGRFGSPVRCAQVRSQRTGGSTPGWRPVHFLPDSVPCSSLLVFSSMWYKALFLSQTLQVMFSVCNNLNRKSKREFSLWQIFIKFLLLIFPLHTKVNRKINIWNGQMWVTSELPKKKKKKQNSNNKHKTKTPSLYSIFLVHIQRSAI